MGFLSTILNTSPKSFLELSRNGGIRFSKKIIDCAHADTAVVLQQMVTTEKGLAQQESEDRLEKYGHNEVAREKRLSWLERLLENIKNPLVILLTVLGVISYLTGDLRATIVIAVMVLLGVVLRYVQEMRADNAAAELKAMVSTTCTVIRDGQQMEISLQDLVPGDIVKLSAGDMVPGDLRVLFAKDLFINQSTLTGESMPVEKYAATVPAGQDNPVGDEQYLLPGLQRGKRNRDGGGRPDRQGHLLRLAGWQHRRQRVLTSFDKGINGFTWLMLGFMAIMVPAVFLINGISKGNWLEAFLFALAVAVGLTPEMLPMIVTVNLSKGAIAMSRQKVIVKRLNSIQNFGAMDVLCTDKTGTITEGKIVLEKYTDVQGNPSDRVLQYAYINSYFETGLKNLMDVAILNHRNLLEELKLNERFFKIDEIPFDFTRKRMSVIVEDKKGANLLICKGAVEEIMPHVHPCRGQRRSFGTRA